MLKTCSRGIAHAQPLANSRDGSAIVHSANTPWNQPNLAWAIDATEYGRDQSGRKLFVVAIIDLASRHHFEPFVTFNPRAEDVTGHLRKIFRRHGPPLLLKRDNGSPFKNASLDALLAGACVIPLNSPAHYPQLHKYLRKFLNSVNF